MRKACQVPAFRCSAGWGSAGTAIMVRPPHGVRDGRADEGAAASPPGSDQDWPWRCGPPVPPRVARACLARQGSRSMGLAPGPTTTVTETQRPIRFVYLLDAA